LVAFVGGNLNNCQIIGRCYEWVLKLIKRLL
jgi:hypothetical protein